MHICVSLMILVSISSAALNAAAESTTQLFAFYNPCTNLNCIDAMHAIEDTARHMLTLNIPATRTGWSTTVQLIGDELSSTSNKPADFKSTLTSFATPIKLSALVKKHLDRAVTQKHELIPLLESLHTGPNFAYIWGKFLLINAAGEKVLLSLSNNPPSVAAIMEELTTDACIFPVAVVDLNVWLTRCFGADWAHTLPVYRGD